MIQGETLPKNAILDTLLYQSNIELFLSTCYSDTNDINYPDVIFLSNNTVQSFAFVWLPENWSNYPINDKRMIIHLHGHCSIGTKHFCKWYEVAYQKNIAVLSLQYWMGDEEWKGGNLKPDGDYSYYISEPGQNCGWHLNIEDDIYPFIDKLIEYYDLHSVMLHGFSMAAATSTIVTYRDDNNKNIIDLTVFNAGHIGINHYFYNEISSIENDSPLISDKYYFFLENIDPDIYSKQSATRDFLLGKGVNDINTVVAENNNYKHGSLLNNEDFSFVREHIITVYDSLTTKE